MAVKNSVQVLIGGKIITLSGYESEEYLQKVAAYMNGKMTELAEIPGYNRQPQDTRHTQSGRQRCMRRNWKPKTRRCMV